MNNKVGAIGFSLLVHVVAFGLIAISFSQKMEPLGMPQEQPEAVEAVVVDNARVQEELRRLKNTEQFQREAEAARQRKAEQELEQARKAREEENRTIAELKQKREQALREAQHEAELQRKQLAELKVQQTELEKKRQQEQERFADAEKKRKSEEAKAQKLEADRKMREQMAAEEKRLALARKQQRGKWINQYQIDIQNKIRSNWLRPAGNDGDFECRLAVRQTVSGEVVSVKVTKSCGNPALDRSVEAAVRKASPLPEPPSADVFDEDLDLTFRPHN